MTEETNAEARRFIVAAVKELFRRLDAGLVQLDITRVPVTAEALRKVRFDENGDPILTTIEPPVRALAAGLISAVPGALKAVRRETSPVMALLGQPVRVDDEMLRRAADEGAYSPLAFELYKETAIALSVCRHSYVAPQDGAKGLPRNQAICVGLLVRIVKLMTAVMGLVSENPNRGDVVFGLNRSILESATNLRYLLLKNEERFFDQFVRFSLAPEREQYDLIQRNITARYGEVLPIEKRMLTSIERVCRLSGVAITDVPSKAGDWGGGLRNRLDALGLADLYVGQQRLLSHAVHGTWVDLVQHHLSEVEGGRFEPDPTWSLVDVRMMLPVCLLVLPAAGEYLAVYFDPVPEAEPLVERIRDLMNRMRQVDQAHEASFGRPGDSAT